MIKEICDFLTKNGFKEIDRLIFKGEIERKHNDKVYFKYDLEIDLNPLKEEKLPQVKETQNQIPNTIEYHKYTNTNTFCFGVGIYEDLLYLMLRKDFGKFFEEQIVGYLYAVTHMEIYGYWGAKEFSHDVKVAIKESFKTVFGFDHSKHNILKLINNLNDPFSECFCESTELYNECHKKLVRTENITLSKRKVLNRIYEAYPDLEIKNRKKIKQKEFKKYVQKSTKRNRSK